MNDVPLQLFDPRLGQPALKVEALGPAGIDLSRPQRFNYFTIVWAGRGAGTFWADLAHHRFEAQALLFAVPYQIVRIGPCDDDEAIGGEAAVDGVVIQFHANFLCIETHHAEVGCNGVLFNAGCGVPLVRMDDEFTRQFAADVDALRAELRDAGLAQSEALIAQLKLLLIRSTRAKLRQQDVAAPMGERLPQSLVQLRELIETRYLELRRPGDYARLLHVAPKTLAKLVKTHLGTTLTELLRERTMRQAKWEMLHTTKTRKAGGERVGIRRRLLL